MTTWVLKLEKLRAISRSEKCLLIKDNSRRGHKGVSVEESVDALVFFAKMKLKYLANVC